MPTKISKKGKVMWTAQVRRQLPDGTLFRKQRLCATRREAIAWESELRAVLDREAAEIATGSWVSRATTTMQWAEEYLDHCNRFCEKTMWEKQRTFKLLFAAEDSSERKIVPPDLPAANLSGYHAQKVLDWVYKTKGGGVANRTRKNLCSWWTHQARMYKILDRVNPFTPVRKYPEQSEEQYTPPEEDFWKVVEMTEGQDRAMILTYFYSAARRTELFRLQVKDLDFERGTITLRSRKNRVGTWTAKELPMLGQIKELLRNHVQGKKRNDHVFINPLTKDPYIDRKHWTIRLCKRAGVKSFGYHGIRRLSASVLAREGIPMIDIQQVLRHEALATTERYLRGMNDLKKSMEILDTRFQK